MSDLILRNVRPMGAPAADLAIRGGRIAAVGPDLPAEGAAEEDCGGRIVVPGLIDAHTHLDKSLIGWPWYVNEVGPSLMDRISNERRVKRELGLDPRTQAMRHALQAVGHGTTHVRSHVDVDTERGLAAVEGVMAAREALAGVVDIEIVAFPQSGLMIRPGTAELLDRAMAMGADLVGGLDPCGIDRDPKGHLDVVFGLAERHGRPVDIHLHEPGEMGAFSLELILERAEALGMRGKVAVSHAFCLGMPDWPRVEGLIARLAELDVRILTTAPASVPVPPLERLAAAGVKLAAGNDGVRDTWSPYGTADMLERARFVGLRNNLRRDDALEAALATATTGAAAVMDVEGHGVAVGCAGDLTVVEGETVAEAVAVPRPRPLTVKGGRVTARDGRALMAAP